MGVHSGFIPKRQRSSLDELWSYAALAQNVWQQTWQPDDLIVGITDEYCTVETIGQQYPATDERCQVLARATDG